MLLKTITAFTLAHSLTVAAATLGYVHVPSPPLEAAIALSIMFVGVEVLRSWQGETSLTLRKPWLGAFGFGFVHGLEFASGLAILGLPEGDIPVALLLFNVGVEAGQLFFVAIMLLLVRSLRHFVIHLPRPVRTMPAYVVGSRGDGGATRPSSQGSGHRCTRSRYLYAYSICGPRQPASTDPR